MSRRRRDLHPDRACPERHAQNRGLLNRHCQGVLVLAADVHSKEINAKIPPNRQQGAGQQLRIPPCEAELKKHILTKLYRARQPGLAGPCPTSVGQCGGKR